MIFFLPKKAKIDGLEFPLSGLPIPHRKKRHLVRGDYETPERTLIKGFVKPGMKVLEFGASLGIVSTFIARQIGPAGALLSVEADPSLLPFWERNLSHNGLKGKCIPALACPTWTSRIPSRLLETAFNPCADKLSGRIQTASAGSSDGQWKTAHMVCTQENFTPDALVIDIEGTETVWLDEAVHMPAHVKLAIVEFHPQYTGPDKAAQCVQALVDDGFRIAGYQNHVMAFTR
jgi:FkbM family methyltransferase